MLATMRYDQIENPGRCKWKMPFKRSKIKEEMIDGKLTQDSRKKPRFENHHKQERKCVEDKNQEVLAGRKRTQKTLLVKIVANKKDPESAIEV